MHDFYCPADTHNVDLSLLESMTKMESNFQLKASGIFYTEDLKLCFLKQKGHLKI